MSVLLAELMRFSMGTERWHAIPFSLKVEKTTWSVATDGYVMLAVKSPGATFRKDYPKELLDMLVSPAKDSVEVNLINLKRWAGKPPLALVPSGEVAAEDQGVLLGHLIDRRKLAYLLAKVTVPKARAWVVRPGVLGFELEGQWRAFLAGCEDEPEGDEPIFKMDNPGRTSELAEALTR